MLNWLAQRGWYWFGRRALEGTNLLLVVGFGGRHELQVRRLGRHVEE